MFDLGTVDRLAIAGIFCVAVWMIAVTIRIRILSSEPVVETEFRPEALLILVCLSPFIAMTMLGAWKENIVFFIGIGLCLFWASVFVFQAWDKVRWARLKRSLRKMHSVPTDRRTRSVEPATSTSPPESPSFEALCLPQGISTHGRSDEPVARPNPVLQHPDWPRVPKTSSLHCGAISIGRNLLCSRVMVLASYVESSLIIDVRSPPDRNTY